MEKQGNVGASRIQAFQGGYQPPNSAYVSPRTPQRTANFSAGFTSNMTPSASFSSPPPNYNRRLDT